MVELTQRQKDILIRTALGEARGEGAEGMADVIQVILNRSQSGRYPSDPAAVALQPKQFSTWNKGEGGNNPQQFKPSDPIYQQAAQALDAVVSGSRPDYTGGALFYHTPAVNPNWAGEVNRHGTIQRNGHIFYPSRPVPPGEIPNVVASRTDTTPQNRTVPFPQPRPERSRVQGAGQAPTSMASTVVPTLNATPRLSAEGVYSYNPSDMTTAQIAGGRGSLTPDFFNTPPVPLPRPRPPMNGDPGGGGIGELVARVNPTTGQTDSYRDVPRPPPRPIMSGDPGGGGLGELIATIPSPPARLPDQRLPPIMQSSMASPRMIAASFDRLDDERRPELQDALERSISAASAPVNPILEYNRLRGNPDITSASLAARRAPTPGPTLGLAKDESRLAPTDWGGIAPMPVKAAAAPINVVATPPMLQARAPAPVAQPSPLMASFRNVPPPRPRPEIAVSRPAPLMAASQQPVQVVVQGAGSYNSPSVVRGSATGNNYNTGQTYQSAGYNYQFNNDGSVTNTDTGITRGGSRRSYDPDTNSWN